MPRKKNCHWTRTLEIQLVEFIRTREFIWKYTGNTNHHIQQKYKAYAEFAANLGSGFTARSVRDRWVNIRNTFNYNLRKVDRSKETAKSPVDIYVPSWPLWKPLQFLQEAPTKEDTNLEVHQELSNETSEGPVEPQSTVEVLDIGIRQRGQQTSRPRRRAIVKKDSSSCKKVLDDLIKAMAPLLNSNSADKKYQYFGKYVTEKLNSMMPVDAESAYQDILRLFDEENDALEPLSSVSKEEIW